MPDQSYPKPFHPKRRHRFFSSVFWRQRLLFWGGAVIVGLVAALFAMLCGKAEHLFKLMLHVSPLLPLAITPLGFLISAYVTKRFFQGAAGSGIPNVIAARQLTDMTQRSNLVSIRIIIGKIVLTAFGLLSGASIGREGPTVQIGAAIMLAVGRFFGRNKQYGVILAGGAAGIAAAFNTPLAGIVFAIEELSRKFERRSSNFVLTAIIFAGVSSIVVTGDYTYFGRTNAAIRLHDWPVVILCGVVGGVMGGLFSRFIIAVLTGQLPYGITNIIKRYPLYYATLCGFTVAVLGLLSHNTIYGTGYEQAGLLIQDSHEIPWYFGLMKMIATALSSVSGIPGGFFAPSLATGAGFGANIAHFMPNAPVHAVVILGMVAYFSGIVQAPITAFVIVFEMTDNHAMVVPIMAAALIATAISRTICRKSIYHTLAEYMLDAMRQETPESAG